MRRRPVCTWLTFNACSTVSSVWSRRVDLFCCNLAQTGARDYPRGLWHCDTLLFRAIQAPSPAPGPAPFSRRTPALNRNEGPIQRKAMSDQLPVPTASNTFERIKRTNPSGGEFWSARELARVLETPPGESAPLCPQCGQPMQLLRSINLCPRSRGPPRAKRAQLPTASAA